MLYLFLVVLLLGAGLWIFTWKTGAPYTGEKPAMVLTEGVGEDTRAIPRIIWSYWHSEKRPLLVEHCLANWKKYTPDHEIRMLHPAIVPDYLDKGDLPSCYAELPEYRKADWLRLALLQRYGGIWLDASLFLTDTLDWVQESQRIGRAGYVGFYIDKFTTDHSRPVVENWFMAACPHNAFIEDLCTEFTRQVIEKGGGGSYLEMLRNEGEYAAAVQNINQPDYLVMHVAAGRLLLSGKYRLCLLRAEDLAFYYPALFNWSKTALYLHLAVYRANARLPGVIKFRSGDRNYFQRRLRLGLYSRHSVVGRYLLSLK